MMNSDYNWPPLECDENILNQYIKALGVQDNIIFKELISFDQRFDNHVLAVLALYQCDRNNGQSKVIKQTLINSQDLKFLIRQVKGLDKACGLIAILNCLGNIEGVQYTKDSILDIFFRQAYNLQKDPNSIGELLLNNKEFQNKHKEFASLGQSTVSSYKSQNRSNHFVGFLVINDALVELSGGINGAQFIQQSNDCLKSVIEEMTFRLNNKLITDNMSLHCIVKKIDNID